jgi:hypothetical protein
MLGSGLSQKEAVGKKVQSELKVAPCLKKGSKLLVGKEKSYEDDTWE